jgi:hypothetical protein
MKEDDHRKRVCDAFAGYIAKRKDIEINKVSYPDKKDRTDKEVDVLIKHKDGEIVIEHTRIESFTKQIERETHLQKLLWPLRTKLSGQLPIGDFELSVDVKGVKRAKNIKEIQVYLIKWIMQKAPLLSLGPADTETLINQAFQLNDKEIETSTTHCIREKPDGVPFEVSLCRFPGYGEFERSLYIYLNVPEDLEEKRKVRINEAIGKKCPKLNTARSRCQNGTSIFLLELNDISLGNANHVYDAFDNEFIGRNDVPDEIYLLRTETDEWMIWIFKEGEWIPHTRPVFLNKTQIDSMVLYIEKFVDRGN